MSSGSASTGDQRFEGRIGGFGTASGTRLVLGLWERSPLGRFADVMIEDARGHRILLAPSPEVAAFVSSTYTFDEVQVVPLAWRRVAGGLALSAGADAGAGAGVVASVDEGADPGVVASEGGEGERVGSGSRAGHALRVRLRVGEVPALGRVLRAVPPRLATAPAWLRAIDPVAALLVPGVHTAGSAGGGRREFYGVTTMRRIAWAEATLDGRDLGAFAPLHPPVRFGFGSAPADPHLVDIVTTIRTA